MILTVHVEWPTGSEDIDVQLEDGATQEEIEQAAQEAFFNTCNYGWSIDGVQQ